MYEKKVLNRKEISELVEFLNHIVDDVQQLIEDRKERGFDLAPDESQDDTKYYIAQTYNRIRSIIQGKNQLTVDDYGAAAATAMSEVIDEESARNPHLKNMPESERQSRIASSKAMHERQFTVYCDETFGKGREIS